MGLIPIYTVYFIGNRIYSDFRIYFIFSHRWSAGCLFKWCTVLYLLYQSFHFPCICPDLSGYAGNALFRDPDQDEMDGCCVCIDCSL